jgi:tyrosyl-tRNA synthetase
MHRKLALAADIVGQIHGADAARQAAEHFKRAIQEGVAVDAADVASGTLLDVVMALRSCSKTQARRLVAGGGVRIDGERQSDPTVTVSKGAMVRIGKRTWGRVT